MKREMEVVRREAEDRLHRDRLMEAEERVVANGDARSSLTAPSGLEFDFSDSYFPESGGGPMSFWAGSYSDDTWLEGHGTGPGDEEAPRYSLLPSTLST